MAQKWASRIAEGIFWGIDLEGFRRSSGSERFSPPPQDKWMTRDNLMQPAIFVGGEIVFFFHGFPIEPRRGNKGSWSFFALLKLREAEVCDRIGAGEPPTPA